MQQLINGGSMVDQWWINGGAMVEQCCCVFEKFSEWKRVSGMDVVNQANVLILQQVLHFCNSPGAMQ